MENIIKEETTEKTTFETDSLGYFFSMYEMEFRRLFDQEYSEGFAVK